MPDDRHVAFQAFEHLLNERNAEREKNMRVYGYPENEVVMNEDPVIFDMDRMRTGQIPDSHRMSDPFSTDNPYGRNFAPDARSSKYKPTRETRDVEGALYNRANRIHAQAKANYEGHLERMYGQPGVYPTTVTSARSMLEPNMAGISDEVPTSWQEFLNGVDPEARPHYERLGELARRKLLASEGLTASPGDVADHIGRLRETRSATMPTGVGRAATELEVGRATARLGRLSRMSGRVLGVAATVGSIDSINRAIFGSGEAFE